MKKNFLQRVETRRATSLRRSALSMAAAAMMLFATGAEAQVTIGSGNLPSEYSLLDLDTSVQKKGFHSPRLDNDQRDALVPPATPNAPAAGLLIFNTTTKCMEYWNGKEWVPLCEGDQVPCDDAVVPVVAPQSFCTHVLASELVPAPSADIAWFTVPDGGNELAANDVVTTGTYYVAAKGATGCYGERVAVIINCMDNYTWTPCTNARASNRDDILFDANGVGCICDNRTNGYAETTATNTGFQNTYRVHRFGSAGLWMTENLRYNNGAEFVISSDPEQSTLQYPNNDPNILTTHPEYGMLYRGRVVGINDGINFRSGEAGSVTSTTQGVCPAGWVLPSDKDWSDLEQEIALHPEAYSSNSGTEWQDAWRQFRDIDIFGVEAIFRGTHGISMKSPYCIDGTSVYKSNTDGTGFNVLPVGQNEVYGITSRFASSTTTAVGVVGRAFMHVFDEEMLAELLEETDEVDVVEYLKIYHDTVVREDPGYYSVFSVRCVKR